jgi:hemerythrin
MVEAGVDHRHLDHHNGAHQGFCREVTAIYGTVSAGQNKSAKILLNFLTNWLVFHILGTDQNMARQIVAVKSGFSPAVAYEMLEKERDAATGPLLAALNGLFEVVSERNKALTELNQSLEEKVAQRTRELSEANLKLEELSLTDPLTGLPNRRHALRSLVTHWQESSQNDQPLSCMMIDADHFKEVNDTCGHDAGDLVLIELAKKLRDSVRTDDIVCRLGGDEFFVICPNTDLAGAKYTAEIVRKKVAGLKVPTGGEPWRGSVSIGVGGKGGEINCPEALIKAADNGVYAAKQAGKNCVRSGG